MLVSQLKPLAGLASSLSSGAVVGPALLRGLSVTRPQHTLSVVTPLPVDSNTYCTPGHAFTDGARRGSVRVTLIPKSGAACEGTDDAGTRYRSLLRHGGHSGPTVCLSGCSQFAVPRPYASPPFAVAPEAHHRVSVRGSARGTADWHVAAGRHALASLATQPGHRAYSSSTAAAKPLDAANETHQEPEGPGEALCEGVQDGATLPSPQAALSYQLCPQGVQGEMECEQFRLWLRTCLQNSGTRGGVGTPDDCGALAEDYATGRRTLEQVFAEYERQILASSATKSEPSTGAESLKVEEGKEAGAAGEPLTSRQKLKAAVRDYGTMVMVFHIGCALISLGSFYLLISSNVDVVTLLGRLPGVSEGTLTRLQQASGLGTFAVAYAAHKLIAPVRIGVTLTCAPVMVRFLRARNILKPPK